MEILYGLEREWRREIQTAWLDKIVEILLEHRIKDQWMEGKTPNGIPVRIPASYEVGCGAIIRVRLHKLEDGILIGRLNQST